MAAWLLPTARAVGWLPLAAVTAVLAASSTIAMAVGTWPYQVTGLVAGAIASSVVAGMSDPAKALLAAMPTSAAVRRAHRLLLLLPVAASVWLGWLGLGQSRSAGLGWPVAGLAALTAAGLAVAVWGAVWLGAAVPLAWVTLAQTAHVGWEVHPELITVAAAAALWTGRNR